MLSSTVSAQYSHSDYYFRSKQTGNWNDTLTWEMSVDNSNWSNANFIPDFVCKTITIQSSHTVTLTASITLDQLIVDGTLIYGDYSGSILTINEGPGVDMIINRTFEDN
jgi:hypothetical protein